MQIPTHVNIHVQINTHAYARTRLHESRPGLDGGVADDQEPRVDIRTILLLGGFMDYVPGRTFPGGVFAQLPHTRLHRAYELVLPRAAE